MNMSRSLAPVLLALVLVGEVASAQIPVTLAVTPRVGLSVPLRDIGPAAPAGGPWYLRLERADAAPTLALDASVGFDGTPLEIRVGGHVTRSATARGVFDCYPGLACPAILLESETDVSLAAASLDVIGAPVPAAWPFHPYVLLGVAVLREAYAWPDAVTLVEGGEHARTGAAARAGVGVDLAAPGGSLRLELTYTWAGEGPAVRPSGESGAFAAPGRNPRSDLGIMIGWKLQRS